MSASNVEKQRTRAWGVDCWNRIVWQLKAVSLLWGSTCLLCFCHGARKFYESVNTSLEFWRGSRNRFELTGSAKNGWTIATGRSAMQSSRAKSQPDVYSFSTKLSSSIKNHSWSDVSPIDAFIIYLLHIICL